MKNNNYTLNTFLIFLNNYSFITIKVQFFDKFKSEFIHTHTHAHLKIAHTERNEDVISDYE